MAQDQQNRFAPTPQAEWDAMFRKNDSLGYVGPRGDSAEDRERAKALEARVAERRLQALLAPTPNLQQQAQIGWSKNNGAMKDYTKALSDGSMDTRLGETLTQTSKESHVDLSKQWEDMAIKFAKAGRPKESNEYFKMSQEAKSKALAIESEGLKVNDSKIKLVGDIAGTVNNAASANDAAAKLRALGREVPPEALDFTKPQALEWWKTQALISPNVRAINSLRLQELSLEETKQLNKTNTKFKERINDRADAAAARASEGMAKAKIVAMKPSAVRLEADLLAEESEKFDSLSSDQQKSAAQEIKTLQLRYMQTEGLPADEAKKRAQQHILKSLESPTKEPLKASTQATKAPSTEAEWKAYLGPRWKAGYTYRIDENNQIKGVAK